MVKHIVFWKLRGDCDKDDATRQIADVLQPLVGVVPGLLSAEVRRVYEGDFDTVLYSELTDRAAAQAYQTHPAHLKAKETVHSFAVGRAAGDYEV
ncbi:MAG: Dabb family protein [Pygmaiobacter sp.]|jgi:quinol monooxygenase YgiN|nr:Dabb family protein [Pygmaiobacter sp.]